MSETLYRGMDRDEIDRQLNLRARWPEHEEYFERWARDSASARARLDARLDLAYGASEGQTLDLFPTAAGSEPAPLLALAAADADRPARPFSSARPTGGRVGDRTPVFDLGGSAGVEVLISAP